MSTTYQEELVCNLWDEAAALLERHWREVAHYQDIALDPDRENYEAMEKAGMLICYTARHADKLVGYAVFTMRRALHYKGSLQAMQDVLYVAPEHRLGMAGVRLIKFAEHGLAARGVQVVYHHAKRTNKVGELLGRLGYELVDEIWAKRLDEKE